MNLPLVRHKIVITYRKFSIRYKTCKFTHYNYHYRGTGQWPDGRISLLLLCWHLYQTLAGNVLEISSEFNIHNVSLLYNTFLFILKGTALSCLKLSLYCMGTSSMWMTLFLIFFFQSHFSDQLVPNKTQMYGAGLLFPCLVHSWTIV